MALNVSSFSGILANGIGIVLAVEANISKESIVAMLSSCNLLLIYKTVSFALGLKLKFNSSFKGSPVFSKTSSE